MPRSVIGPGGERFEVYEPVVAHINGAARTPSVEILPATSFTVAPIRWIWDGWLARGKLHLLAGAPGTGKTTIALSIASTITAGGRWPDGSDPEQGDVLIWRGRTVLPTPSCLVCWLLVVTRERCTLSIRCRRTASPVPLTPPPACRTLLKRRGSYLT